ncbi:hypothetical protein ACFWPQ_01805 [Streptomyces sp. NPDC058464]|uniref:hypothetical protein n=1 Tax=Streptomyces sp. NPDC058464 TaxID=3346511 RepID=UPI0036693782
MSEHKQITVTGAAGEVRLPTDLLPDDLRLDANGARVLAHKLFQAASQADPVSNNFVARYYQYHQLHEAPCESVEDAIGLLAAGLDSGTSAPHDVTRKNGTVVLNHAETLRRIEATLEVWDAESAG